MIKRIAFMLAAASAVVAQADVSTTQVKALKANDTVYLSGAVDTLIAGFADQASVDAVAARVAAVEAKTNTWNTVTQKADAATTLAGYGITDAKIENGTITLGSATITPLTSFTETDPTVPEWAKAQTKPSYAFSEITNTPTTLAGYGITDAKIEDGTITLGASTITPLTAHQDISGKVDCVTIAALPENYTIQNLADKITAIIAALAPAE